MRTSSAVRKANKASSSQLLSSLADLAANDVLRSYIIVHSIELDDHQRKDIWDIFESNMRNLYSESSFGWDPESKVAELFAPLSRFILVHAGGRLVAFVVFRFEYEYCENTLYCYDLQVLNTYQRSGLGKFLMLGLEKLGSAWGMVKITLTVFKANKSACLFYQAFGFKIDVSSPGYMEAQEEKLNSEEEVDYEILSKQLENP